MPVQFSSKHAVAQFFPVLKIAGDTTVRAPVALTKAVCVVGRRWGVHLPLASKQVSKLHALIVRERDGVYIRDLASRNRLFVNGHPVREADLAPGDVVNVGPYALKCASGFTSRDGEGAPGARGPAAFLEPDRGGAAPVALDGRAVLIGRRDECDLVLAGDDETVSPVHAVVFEIDGKRFVRDLTSASGTLVNGQKIHQEELRPGDELRIGRTRIRYTVQGAEGAAAAEAVAAGVGAPSGIQESVPPEASAAGARDAAAPSRVVAAAAVDADEAASAVAAPSPFDDIFPVDDDEPTGGAAAMKGPPVDDEGAPVVNLAEIVSVPTHFPDDEDDRIAIDLEPADDAAPQPVAEAEPSQTLPPEADAPTGDPEQLIPLRAGDRPVGVIDAAVQAVAAATPEEAVAEDQDNGGGFSAIPLANVIELDLAVGGLPPAEAEVREHTPPAIAASRPPDCGDSGGGENPDPPPHQRPDDPARKLDRIVSELADRVADLGATWDEVKAKGDPDR